MLENDQVQQQLQAVYDKALPTKLQATLGVYTALKDPTSDHSRLRQL